MPADSLVTGIVRQRYLPIEEVVQLPPPDVMHLMFVIVRTVAKGTVVVLEIYGSFRTGMVHGLGRVVVESAGHVAGSVAPRYRRFPAQLESDARPSHDPATPPEAPSSTPSAVAGRRRQW